ncbi:MAG: hypothetical protein NTW16_02685, partial [Bacteroidetes bacterium]|nr:hypothetical protein [Bacteroidota bacterium]
MNKIKFTLLIVVLLPVLVHAQFTGGNGRGDVSSLITGRHLTNWFKTNGNWSNVGNWSDAALPASSDNANVMAAAVVDGNYSYQDLTITAAGSVTISPTKSMTVTRTLTNSAGTTGLVIKSDASGTGSLITTSSVSGTVERYIANDLKWHFLSSPVAAQPIWPEFAPTPSGVSLNLTFGVAPWKWDFYYWNPKTDTTSQLFWVNLRQDASGTYNSWDIDKTGSEAGYGAATPAFTVGRGYLTAYNTGWNAATGSPETHQFTGTLNSGTVEKAIIQGANSFNLIGNPYPSSIDWKAASGWTRNGLATSMGGGYDYWIYNKTAGNYGVFNSITAGDNGTNGTSRNIAPMQGFFVLANPTPGTFAMTSAVQVHASQTWLKEGQDADNLLRLKLSTSANTFSDE